MFTAQVSPVFLADPRKLQRPLMQLRNSSAPLTTRFARGTAGGGGVGAGVETGGVGAVGLAGVEPEQAAERTERHRPQMIRLVRLGFG